VRDVDISSASRTEQENGVEINQVPSEGGHCEPRSGKKTEERRQTLYENHLVSIKDSREKPRVAMKGRRQKGIGKRSVPECLRQLPKVCPVTKARGGSRKKTRRLEKGGSGTFLKSKAELLPSCDRPPFKQVLKRENPRRGGTREERLTKKSRTSRTEGEPDVLGTTVQISSESVGSGELNES